MAAALRTIKRRTDRRSPAGRPLRGVRPEVPAVMAAGAALVPTSVRWRSRFDASNATNAWKDCTTPHGQVPEGASAMTRRHKPPRRHQQCQGWARPTTAGNRPRYLRGRVMPPS